MKHRFAALSFVILVLASPAFARVLSYAPYSNRGSVGGTHERTSRHFVLIEAIDDSTNWFIRNQLVLYDTTGAREPRVVYPQNGGTAWITAAGLYERKDDPAAPPILMASVWEVDGTRTHFSADGGMTWKVVQGTEAEPTHLDFFRSDFGGPSAKGMASRFIRTGNDAIPFIVSYSLNHGIVGIDANGVARPIHPGAYVIGHDRARSRLLVCTQLAIKMMNVDGTNSKTIVQFTIPAHQSGLSFTGWITADGSAYIQAERSYARFLFLHRNEMTRFVAGPYDETPFSLTETWPPTSSTGDLMDFFAVPTHDFEGAWLLQRKATRPTTLSRHTPNAGITTMWSDPAGPEVEALIAGNSGQTLLIQVHRDRAVQMQQERRFVDPALAIWRVGDPMPRQYDELYLNEERDKGFIHVDVDRMAAGEPFVFNSGTSMSFPGGDISAPVGGGGDVVQEWGVVRGSLRQHLVLPGVARLNGAFNSRWLTDVTIYNPLDTAQDVDVRFIALGEAAAQAFSTKQKVVTLEPREIRFIPDVLQALFGIEDGGGALHFLPASGINVVGRTYSSKAGGGTLGFGMQAIDFFNTAGPRFPVTFAGAFPGPNFRTNVLLTDTSGVGTEASMNAMGRLGTLATDAKTIAAPPGGILQFNGLDAALGAFSADARGLVIQPTRGTAIATVVAIDNQTNDATYFPPDVVTSLDEIRVIPVIGHLDGAYGSHFRTDLYLFNPGSELAWITLEAKQWDGPAVKQLTISMHPRSATVIRDALLTRFEMTGLARLRYWMETDGQGVRVTSRTYTVDENGATYGTLIPTLNHFQAAAPGDRLEILGISGGIGFRTNLGLVELSQRAAVTPTSVRIRVLDERLRLLDEFTVAVPSAGGRQLNDIFASRNITPPEAAMLEIEVLNGGLIGAYVSLVDNITNDSTYLGSQLGAQEN